MILAHAVIQSDWNDNWGESFQWDEICIWSTRTGPSTVSFGKWDSKMCPSHSEEAILIWTHFLVMLLPPLKSYLGSSEVGLTASATINISGAGERNPFRCLWNHRYGTSPKQYSGFMNSLFQEIVMCRATFCYLVHPNETEEQESMVIQWVTAGLSWSAFCYGFYL